MRINIDLAFARWPETRLPINCNVAPLLMYVFISVIKKIKAVDVGLSRINNSRTLSSKLAVTHFHHIINVFNSAFHIAG